MQKSYFGFATIVIILFTIILSPLLPALAYDDKQLAFANQQITMTENKINNNDSHANGNRGSSIVPKVVF